MIMIKSGNHLEVTQEERLTALGCTNYANWCIIIPQKSGNEASEAQNHLMRILTTLSPMLKQNLWSWRRHDKLGVQVSSLRKYGSNFLVNFVSSLYHFLREVSIYLETDGKT